MFIGLNASLCVLYIKVELLQLLQNQFINRYTMIAYDDATVKRNITHLFAPFVIEDLLDSVSFGWIDV